jgi:hypothetical protein
MRPPSHSPDSQSQAERLLDPIGRIWLACSGLLFILGSLSIKEVNTLMFLVGSLFALLSFNGTRLSGITLGKDKVSAEMGLPGRVAELRKDNTMQVKIRDDAEMPSGLLRELSKPFNAGIQTEGYGLAQLINVDQQDREKMLQQISISSGITSLSGRSIVGIGRVQDSRPSGRLFALIDDGSDYIVDYPSSLTEIFSKASTDVGDGEAARPISLTGAIQEDQNNE